MTDKTKVEGIKLLAGGKEVTEEDVKIAIREYQAKMNSPEYIAEIKNSHLFDSVAKTSYKYYRLPVPPNTIFKVDNDNFVSYKFDETKKAWIEFPVFITDLEHGNIRVEEIEFEDNYPTITAVDQLKGVKL